MFLIKEATLFKNFSYEVKCIIPEDLNKYILMIFKKIEDDRKIDDQSQYTIFDETFSILSHEINNPLSSIKMASQIMTKSKIFDKELFDIISSETERITKNLNLYLLLILRLICLRVLMKIFMRL